MHIVIEGTDLPGSPGVLVGVQVGTDVHDVVPATAAHARWTVDVDVVPGTDGVLDVRGKAVHGRRGSRFLYLTWGTTAAGAGFAMFRRTKLMLDAVDETTLRAAQDGAGLLAALSLTAADGSPRSAAVRPPYITWTALG